MIVATNHSRCNDKLNDRRSLLLFDPLAKVYRRPISHSASASFSSGHRARRRSTRKIETRTPRANELALRIPQASAFHRERVRVYSAVDSSVTRRNTFDRLFHTKGYGSREVEETLRAFPTIDVSIE